LQRIINEAARRFELTKRVQAGQPKFGDGYITGVHNDGLRRCLRLARDGKTKNIAR
jgi:hypothetical protein